MSTFSYSVAIRTLGTAGEKYRKLLDSITRQTIQPEKIVVVLPEGYALPREQLGTEEFVFSRKGMVIQRIKALEYINSEYTLFCDDDVEFGTDFVEKLVQPMEEQGYSCTAAPQLSFLLPNTPKYWLASVLGGACVMLHGREHYYVRMLRTGGWSYNNGIDTTHHRIYDTDSLVWACFCIKTDVMRAIHMEEEIWFDRTSYAAYDDQTMAYKLRVNGYRIGIVSDAEYIHNDGKTSITNMKLEPIYAHSFNGYIFWHRFLYLLSKNPIEKMWVRICVEYRHIMGSIYGILLSVEGRRTKEQVAASRKGLADARRYVKTMEYKSLSSPIIRGEK